jgi:uncharacterized protein YbbC (DUF1343 family)
MAQSFQAQVDAWVQATEARMLAVFRTAAQYVSLDGPLPMRGKAGDGYVAPEMTAVIAGADLGDTIYGSFVAEYAGFQEYGANGRPGAGMVRLSVQNWQAHVDRATAEAKASVQSRG